MGEKMYIGLDMGTNSVGMAVTDENYELYRAKGKDYWCARTFDRAETAAERRTNRIARRRRQRETARLGLLRELFAEEIAKLDPGFYARLDESKYHLEDRENQQPYALFADKTYTDKDYYKEYPTIFHLRKALLASPAPRDVRLLYLALANMFKHRGHFLNESLGSDAPMSDTQEAYAAFYEIASGLQISFPQKASPGDIDPAKLESLLSAKDQSRTERAKAICAFLNINKQNNKALYTLVNLICGLRAKFADLFGPELLDEESSVVNFSAVDGLMGNYLQ